MNFSEHDFNIDNVIKFLKSQTLSLELLNQY